MPVPDFSPGEVLTAAAMDSIGLWLVGSVTVGAGVTTVPVLSVFSSTYENYRIIISGVDAAAAGTPLSIQLNNQTTGVYRWSVSVGTHGGNAFSNQGDTGNTTWIVTGYTGTGDDTYNAIEMSNPFSATRQTAYTAMGSATNNRWYSGGVTTTAASNTGFTLTCASALTGGTIRVYGYRN